MPYAIDLGRRSVVMVRVQQKAVNSSTRAFYYQAQRDLATSVYLVPFNDFHSATESFIPSEEQKSLASSILIVQSTGRCGSTLLSKLMHAAGHTFSVSEPDVFTSIFFCLPSLARDEAIRLLRNCTVLYSKAIQQYRKIPDETILLKHRSCLTNMTDLLALATPEAKVSESNLVLQYPRPPMIKIMAIG
jgi:hypothetical protein